MDRTRFSGWLLFATLVALVPLQGSREAGSAPSGKTEEKTAGAAKEETKGASQPWEGPARLVANLAGVDWDGKGDGRALWLNFAAKSRQDGFTRFDPLVVLVPCPLESNLAADFDQAIAALQEAYADAGYLLEGWWLPWSSDLEKDRAREQVPGLMVFRHYQRRERAVALVIGEIPGRGVYRAAFREALAGARRWAADTAVEPQQASGVTVRVLGPALSDSALSLHLAVEEAKPGPGLSFEVVTGSARGKDVAAVLQPSATTSFARTVVSEDEMQTRARQFFVCGMGWKPQQIALLTEADNAYGQPFLTPENARDSLLVRFPPGIAGVRNAWDRDQRPRETATAQGTVKVPEVTLDLRLGERGRPVQVPELSTLTAASRDLAIANLLAALADRKVSYIGVLASDPRDAAFLIDRIRRFAPSALLFLVDSDLVFTHPKLGPTLNSTLVVSGFPLFAADEPPRSAPAGETERHYLRQFTSDVHAGVYLAARRLIASTRGELAGGGRPPGVKVWISAVGNGSLWPLAQLGAGASPGVSEQECRAWSQVRGQTAAAVNIPPIAATTGTKLLVSAIALAVLSCYLAFAATPPRQAGWRACALLAAAASALGLAAGVLTVLGSLPYRFSGKGLHQVGPGDWKQVLAAFFLLVTAVFLLAIVVLALSAGRRRSLQLALPVLVPVLAAALLFGLDRGLRQLWLLGGVEFFLRRAFTFSSGLSPLVSLGWLAGSLYLWAFVELRRERMQARQVVEWPGPDEGPSMQPFARCRRQAEELRKLLDGPWPWWTGMRSLWVLVLPFLLSVPLLALLLTVHPIAEPRAYGRIFLVLLVFTFILGTYSFCRFLGAWLILQKILEQLALPHPPAGLDRQLAELVGWSPMKSFGWAIPRFTMSTLIADHVRRLAESGKIRGQLGGRVRQEMESAFEAQRDQSLEQEIAARDNLRQVFDQAYRQLGGRSVDDPDVRRMVNLRLVSYVRYIFAHLRLCLIAAGACGFPLLVAASTYAFEPNELVTNGIWAALLVAILLTLFVFLQMDRDVVLSLISGTTPKKIQLNRQLVTNFLTYGAVPILGLIASQFPQIGRYTVSLVNPLLRAVGGGP